MRILIDYDGTISVKGKICNKKIELIKAAQKKGHTVMVYTSRKGEAVTNLKAKIKRLFNLDIKAMGGRQNYDYFLDLKAGDWEGLKKFLGEK